jgi:hypothetical protein
MHIFIISKIRHSYRKYDMRKRCGKNHGLNQAKVWPAGRSAMFWRISKHHFVYASSRGSAQGIQCPKVVQGGNLAARLSCMAARPNKWASHAQSSARAPPYSSYKYHGAPPGKWCEESEV